MRFYIHILTDTERFRDREGQECTDLNEAQLEANLSARELIAQELQAGRPVPLGWKLHIADDEDTILATVSFAALVFDNVPPASGD